MTSESVIKRKKSRNRHRNIKMLSYKCDMVHLSFESFCDFMFKLCNCTDNWH
jgi:hypothetical protein